MASALSKENMKQILIIITSLVFLGASGCDFYYNNEKKIRISSTYVFENSSDRFSAFTMHEDLNKEATFAAVLVFEKEFFDKVDPQISSWGGDKASFEIEGKTHEINNGTISFYDHVENKIVSVNTEAFEVGKIDIKNDRFSEDFEAFLKERKLNKSVVTIPAAPLPPS